MPLEGNSLERLNANNDQGLWLEQNFLGDLTKYWSFLLHSEQRWGANYSKFYYQRYDFLIYYDITRFLKIPSWTNVTGIRVGGGSDLNYRIQRNTREFFHWVLVQRSILEGQIEMNWRQWNILHRLRIEYENFLRKHYIDHGILRYRVIVNSPWKFTCWNINPYISNEIFVRKNSFDEDDQTGLVGGLHSNRFRIGVNVDLIINKLTSALYWQWIARKQRPGSNPPWSNTYEMGLILNFIL